MVRKMPLPCLARWPANASRNAEIVMPGTTPAGTYDITVKNPDGCGFVLSRSLTLHDAQLGAPAGGEQGRP